MRKKLLAAAQNFFGERLRQHADPRNARTPWALSETILRRGKLPIGRPAYPGLY